MGSEENNLPKPQIKVSDNHNTLSINNSTINIPDVVATGLTNIGTGAVIAAGLKAGSSVAKTSGFSPAGKLGLVTAVAAVGGVFATAVTTINSMTQKKNDLALIKSVQSNITNCTSSIISKPKGGNNENGFDTSSIEPGVNIDTLMNLLETNYILHICILYLLIAIMILYISTMVLENK